MSVRVRRSSRWLYPLSYCCCTRKVTPFFLISRIAILHNSHVKYHVAGWPGLLSLEILLPELSTGPLRCWPCQQDCQIRLHTPLCCGLSFLGKTAGLRAGAPVVSCRKVWAGVPAGTHTVPGCLWSAGSCRVCYPCQRGLLPGEGRAVISPGGGFCADPCLQHVEDKGWWQRVQRGRGVWSSGLLSCLPIARRYLHCAPARGGSVPHVT